MAFQQQRFEMGRTPGCKGCEALFLTEGPVRPHSEECWARVVGILESIEDGRAALARSKARMEQYQSIMSNSASQGTFREVAAPPAAVHWLAVEDVAAEGSDDETQEV